MDVTLKTFYKNSKNDSNERNVTLWLNKDNTVSLLGNLEHNTTIVINQELVNSLQILVNAINSK